VLTAQSVVLSFGRRAPKCVNSRGTTTTASSSISSNGGGGGGDDISNRSVAVVALQKITVF
jgi:hypothetical protein